MRCRLKISEGKENADNLQAIRETCRCEQVRCRIILKELILQAQAYATTLDETRRLQHILKQFEENIKNG